MGELHSPFTTCASYGQGESLQQSAAGTQMVNLLSMAILQGSSVLHVAALGFALRPKNNRSVKVPSTFDPWQKGGLVLALPSSSKVTVVAN